MGLVEMVGGSNMMSVVDYLLQSSLIGKTSSRILLYVIHCLFVLILFIRVRANIRNGADGFSPANKYFLACLYPTGRGNKRKVEQNFLRSKLLLKVSRNSFFSSYFHVPFCRSSVLSSRRHLQQMDSKKKLWMGQLVRNRGQQGKRKLLRVMLPPS
jgi:hypothetical protein